MKKLKGLNIVFSSHDEFMSGIKDSLFGDKAAAEENEAISFDSIETFKRLMTSNKLEILIAIARLKPVSINQLSKLINREFPHVLKDCRSLETFGFIKMLESGKAKKQLTPKLIFEYDVIRVKAKMEEIFPISEESNRILVKSMVS